MGGRWRAGVLLGCVLVVLLTAWYAGSGSRPSILQPTPGSVRLGPEPGADIVDYLARLPDQLPPPGSAALALVQLDEAVPVTEAATLGPAPVVTAVFRVPLPRVQTALRFADLPPGSPVGPALDTARAQVAEQAGAASQRLIGRPARVAAAEAAALADPGCPCVLALLVEADRGALESLADAAGVRAVHAAPVDAVRVELALAPLLPGQQVRADPLPDDGPVPAG